MFDRYFDRLDEWYKNHKAQVNYVLVWLLRLVVLVAVYAALIICSTGCRSQRVVVTERHDDIRHDTLIVRDSVFRDRVRTEYLRGDTLIIRDSVIVERVRYKNKTVEVFVRDSVPYIVEVAKEIPRRRTAYDRFCSAFFWVVLIGGVAAVAVWLTNRRWNWLTLIWRLFVR